MDALVTDFLRMTSLPDVPGDPTLGAARRWRFSIRSLWLALRRLTGTGSGAGPGAGQAAVARRRALYAYTGTTIVVAGALLAWTSVAVPPLRLIDPGLGEGTILSGPSGGLLLWLVYGLLGSLRILRAPGGTLMTFHMPFVGAAMILGGPTAGAWVALLSTIERRELESQPWYGILFNHSALVLGAILGGITTQVTAAALGPDGGATTALIAALAGTAVLAVVSIALGVGTVVLREDDVSPRAFVETLLGEIGRITLVESALVVVLAAVYVSLGWWAPLLVGGFVILAWDNDPMPAPDPLTGLQTRTGFLRRLESGLGRMRRGLIPGATLMSVDLDGFKEINDRYGHAVGDAVLREVGTRLLGQARRPDDAAGRLGGDEMALFLPGLTDNDTAMRRACEVADAISEPIATTSGVVSVGVSIGILVTLSWGGVPSADTMLRHADQAMYIAKRSGSRCHRHDPDEPGPFETRWPDEPS
jgi:diguanylate cyclase (GGDEF)-like protein